jgi:hypothetical protein
MEKRLQAIKQELENGFNLKYFLQLTDFLTELVTKETQSLKLVKIQEVENIQEVKRKGCELYSKMISFLKESPSSIGSLDVYERKVLKEVTENLSRLLEKNELIIKAFNEANRRVMEIFFEVQQSRSSTNYGANGKRKPPLSGFSNFNQNG